MSDLKPPYYFDVANHVPRSGKSKLHGELMQGPSQKTENKAR